MSIKLKSFTDTILRHKKKSILAVAVAIVAGNSINSKIKDDELRRFYGEKAKQFGSVPIHPNQKLRKVIVLVNNEAKRRNSAKIFNKNSLPLLNLAGIDVDIINISTQSEMENIARTIDYKEADCIFLVGGDGTVCHALNGIFQKEKLQEHLPIGLFPGGNRNKSFSMLGFLKKSVDSKNIVRLCCESTMALIEGKQEKFYPICCRIDNVSDKEKKEKTENVSSSVSLPSVNYLLSEIAFGWFEHCELKAPKFWWIGPLNGYFTYFWEFLKISPKTPIRVEIVYEEFCSGCRKCIAMPKNNASFLSWLFGTSEKADPKLTKLSERENPSCGEVHSIAVSGTDIRLNVEQTEISSKLKLKIVVTIGMLGTLREAWRRARSATKSLEKNLIVDNFDTNIEAKKIVLHFTNIPEKLRKLTISGECFDFSDYLEKEIIIESMRQPLQFFVPNLTEIKEK